MELLDLYKIAEENSIRVECIECPKSLSISLMDSDGSCYIGIDPFMLQSIADEKDKLAHELGHCLTGSFYNRHSNCDVIGRHEYRANKCAVYTALPLSELLKAVNEGYTEVWQLAEYLNWPEDFIRRAVYIYQCNGLIPLGKHS